MLRVAVLLAASLLTAAALTSNNRPYVSDMAPRDPNPYFLIRALDSETGEGIPLVQIRTSHYVQMYTDSQGHAAFFEPGLMDATDVWFSVLTDGYELVGGVPCHPTEMQPCDPGLILRVSQSAGVTISLNRTQVAERMFRLTGAGLYRDTLLGGLPAPVDQPLLDPSGATGQDTLIITTYKGKHYWFFGDTVCARSARQDNCDGRGMYTVGATSCIPGKDADCEAGAPPSLNYFRETDDKGVERVKPMAPILDLKMNTWVGGAFTVFPGTPEEAMYAIFYKPFDFGPHPSSPDIGLIKWDDDLEQFVHYVTWPKDHPLTRSGNFVVELFRPSDPEANDGYVYFDSGVVYARAPQKNLTLDAWEVYTPLLQGSTMDDPKMDPNGYTWKAGMHFFGAGEEAKLIQLGLLPKEKALYQSVDAVSGQPAYPGGSLNYNSYLDAYVALDETKIGFAPSVTGPWTKLYPIANFEGTGSSCYNPLMVTHFTDNTKLSESSLFGSPFVVDNEGDDSSEPSDRFVFMSCSYTAMWSNDKPKQGTDLWQTCLFGQNAHMNCAPVVPRYEYNNLIHRVDLEPFKKMLEDEGFYN